MLSMYKRWLIYEVIIIPCEYFTPALVDDLSMKWQKVGFFLQFVEFVSAFTFPKYVIEWQQHYYK